MEGGDINQPGQNLIGRGGKERGRQVGKSNHQVMGRDISQPGQHLIGRGEKERGCQVGKSDQIIE